MVYFFDSFIVFWAKAKRDLKSFFFRLIYILCLCFHSREKYHTSAAGFLDFFFRKFSKNTQQNKKQKQQFFLAIMKGLMTSSAINRAIKLKNSFANLRSTHHFRTTTTTLQNANGKWSSFLPRDDICQNANSPKKINLSNAKQSKQ